MSTVTRKRTADSPPQEPPSQVRKKDPYAKILERSFAVWETLKFETRERQGECPHFFIGIDPETGEWLQALPNPRNELAPDAPNPHLIYLMGSYQMKKARETSQEVRQIVFSFPSKLRGLSFFALKTVELMRVLARHCTILTKKTKESVLYGNATYFEAEHNTRRKEAFFKQGALTPGAKLIAYNQWLEMGKKVCSFGEAFLGVKCIPSLFDVPAENQTPLQEGEMVVIEHQKQNIFALVHKGTFGDQFKTIPFRRDVPLLGGKRVVTRWISNSPIPSLD